MATFYRAFLCICTLFLSICFSQDAAYVRKLHEIQTIKDAEGPFITGFIHLDDGSVWKWRPCVCCIKKLDNWKTGDEIRILNRIKSKHDASQYALHNGSHPHFNAHVTLISKPETSYPSIASISFENDRDYSFMTLDDGSKWSIGWWSSLPLHDWKAGDHVIITRDEPNWGRSTHMIFNLNLEKTLFLDNSYINATLVD